MSFAQGIFPDELKLARVVPIYKSGDKKEVSNYIPIFVLTFFAKYLKKICMSMLFSLWIKMI